MQALILIVALVSAECRSLAKTSSMGKFYIFEFDVWYKIVYLRIKSVAMFCIMGSAHCLRQNLRLGMSKLFWR